MRIHACTFGGQPIFGALRFTLSEFLGVFIHAGKTCYQFKNREGQIIFFDRDMLLRVRERLVANNLKTDIADRAINNQIYKKIN